MTFVKGLVQKDLVDGNYRVEIYTHLLDLTRNSCEKCNYIGPWQESSTINLRPCDSGAAL